jgi:hypothetical protein
VKNDASHKPDGISISRQEERFKQRVGELFEFTLGPDLHPTDAAPRDLLEVSELDLESDDSDAPARGQYPCRLVTASTCLTDIFLPNPLRKGQDIVPGSVPVDFLQLHDGSRNGLKPRVKADIDFAGPVFLGDNIVMSLR